MNMLDLVKVSTYNSKFDEYLLSRMADWLNHPLLQLQAMMKKHPVVEFDIRRIISGLVAADVSDTLLEKISYKLIDIKMLYVFLRATDFDRSHEGTLIVGNDEIEKLNPDTIQLLNRNHHRVYLISALTEMTLDVLQLIQKGAITDYPKNKWKRIYLDLEPDIHDILIEEEFIEMIRFKDKYRTSELHKYSAVRAFLTGSEWNHFQREQEIIELVLKRLHSKYAT